jgi:hypothetical protein
MTKILNEQFYRMQKLAGLITENEINAEENLTEATDFKSFTVLQPGEGWEEIKYGAGKSFLAFNVDKPEVTLVGSTPEEKNFFDEIAQMVGGQVEEGDKFGFELTIPVAKYEELFNVQ